MRWFAPALLGLACLSACSLGEYGGRAAAPAPTPGKAAPGAPSDERTDEAFLRALEDVHADLQACLRAAEDDQGKRQACYVAFERRMTQLTSVHGSADRIR